MSFIYVQAVQLINTSFNQREPIVETYKMLRCCSTGLAALLMDDVFIARSKSQLPYRSV